MKDKDTSFQTAQDGQITSQTDNEQKIAQVPFTSADADNVNFYLNYFDGFFNSFWNELKTLFAYYGIVFNAGSNNQLLGIFQGIETKAEAYQDGYIKGGIINILNYVSGIPVLTSNTDQGHTCSGSSTVGGTFDYYKAYTESVDVFSANATTGYNTIQLPIAKQYKSVAIRCRDSATETDTAPQNGTIEASNTGAFGGEEETVLTFTGETGWSAGEKRYFQLSTSTSFLYYRTIATLNNGDPNFVQFGLSFSESENTPYDTIDISAIKSRSDNNTQNIDVALLSDLVVSENASWASGTAPSLTNATIHIFADYNSGTPRFILDDNAAGSNIAGGVKIRNRSIITDAIGNIIPFIQNGDKFLYKISILDKSSPTAYGLTTISTPIGIRTTAILSIRTDSNLTYIMALSAGDINDNLQEGMAQSGVTNLQSSRLLVETNTSSQIRDGLTLGTANISYDIRTCGFIDNRGKN